ncbi:Na+/H+ antiporter subunit E [Modestobacter versicolor]|uniref:Na+/H+ antiporter subunit E n=1 Tax=Modestobacter versicolor TaxID=429133 RepID=UPI0034DF19C5
MTAPEVALRRLRDQVPLLVGLVLVWNLLWGTWSWANLISGTVVALAVTWLLPLPPVTGGVSFHPAGVLRYLGRFVLDLAVSSAQVSWDTLRPSGLRYGAIISVRLRTDSDLLLTMVTETLCLTPGSIVIDLDREARTIALHLLSVRDEAEVEAQRAAVLATEDRVVRAFGSAADIAALDADPDPQPDPSGRRPDRRTTS